MQQKSDSIRIKRKSVLYFFIILIALVGVTPALADYLGPDRTVTEWTSACKVVLYECSYVAAKGDWRYHRVDDWSCSNEGKPWKAYPSNPSSQGCFAATEGDTYWEQEETLQEVTNTYPPAIIDSSLQNCTLNNGWCNTAPELSINGTEPVSGFNILAIEGSLNGQTFACSNSTCNVPLSEGDNSFTFWALSSWGDSSAMDTFTARVDTVSPNVRLDVSGSNGTNGWYASPTTLTATGSDSTSGLVSALLSVNSGVWESSAVLNEGVHNINVAAEDNAGNISNSSLTISVDTTTPSIDVNMNGKQGSNGWYISNLDVTANATDTTSGVGAFEVSSDGNTYHAYTTPVSFTNGRHTIQFKATDNAGNFTETPVQEFYIDTILPEIDLPVSWEVGNAITYTTQDNDSGLATVRVVIEDEDERYAKVAWDEIVSRTKFEGEINWDGKFANGVVAQPGEYLVWIKARDVAGNERFGLGRVIVPEPNVLFALFKSDTSFNGTPTPPDELFNGDDPTSVISHAVDVSTVPTASFGGSTTETKEITNSSFAFSSGTASSTSSSSSNVLWGATAAAVIGAATAYALDEQRKRREESDRQRAEIEAEIAEKEAQKEAADEARKVAQWLEGQAILNAQIKEAENRGATSEQIVELKQKGATQGFGAVIGSAANLTQSLQNAALLQVQNARMEAKMTRIEAEEDAQWAISQANEEQARLAAHYSAARQSEKNDSNTQVSWWEKTKSFFQENIAQPVQNTWNIVTTTAQTAWTITTTFVHEEIYIPYIQPVVAVVDKEVYQPYIKPAVEKVKQVVWETGQWINESVYQPYIRPEVEKLKQAAIRDIAWLNENLYRPYIKPVVTAINENIYQPYIQPVVTAIDENFYQPYVKPVVDKTSAWWQNTWDKYGEWVHGALDAAGFVPGLGEIADGINGLIYLGEGRYLEASVSAMAMIPILGDLGKVGKWTLKFGAEVLEETAEKVVKEIVEVGMEKVAKESVEEVAEKTLKEAGEEFANKAAKESLEEASEKILKETGEELAEKSVKDVVEKATNEIIPETVVKTAKETVVTAPVVSTKVSKAFAEETIEESLEQANKETAQFVSSLRAKYGDEMVDRFLPFCENYGINPQDVLTRPPAEGQTLIGWGLGVENPANPVNYPLMNLNLTEAEVNNILKQSIRNPNSKVVVLGYGGGAAIPYYRLGEDIDGCYLSLSPEAWAPFENATANFWSDINAPFIQTAIDERKIFLFNIDYDVIVDPANVRRFSLPELRLIEMEKNNYIQVPVGEYTAFVPSELSETYEQYLPDSLLD